MVLTVMITVFIALCVIDFFRSTNFRKTAGFVLALFYVVEIIAGIMMAAVFYF